MPAPHAPAATPHARRWWVRCAVTGVMAYQVGLRPLLIGQCKFIPSCSEYTIEALQRHGVRRGLWLGTRRVCRCHPFTPGGIDPVPES